MKNLTSHFTFISKVVLSIIAVSTVTVLFKSKNSEPETYTGKEISFDDSLKYFHPNKGE